MVVSAEFCIQGISGKSSADELPIKKFTDAGSFQYPPRLESGLVAGVIATLTAC
jgi:hypothetical protein